ncbi:hypothetical protein [Citromicrobium sp. JLT1363]|uniref:hypothetical protein n=1 Tax=Citromicrobium sp. JLT1363 TaxID=517722 RepID=UPI001111CC4F|nr:hypothetical protein [Citromicrobium sp. JLT1363]
MLLPLAALHAPPLSVPVEPARPPVEISAGTLQSLNPALLDRLCNANGGIGGRFGQVPDTQGADLIGIDGAPRRTFDPHVGPFEEYETWQTPRSQRTHTIRYIAPTTDSLTRETLARHLASIASEGGWKRIEAPEDASVFVRYSMQVSWHKEIERDGEPTLITLMPDGGLSSVSLYCIAQDLRADAEAERQENVGDTPFAR